MLKNYFIIAWRSLVNNKLHSVINVFGLTVGISSCLVIFLIVQFELSFNKQVPDAERIFRVHSTQVGQYPYATRGIEISVRTMIKEQLTGLENAVAMSTYSAKVRVPENKTDFESENIAITEPDYFKLIQGYEWIEGDPQRSLAEPMQVVLTSEKAKKYFGTDDMKAVIGREIHYEDSLILFVSGIVKPLRYRTDFEFTDFISLATVKKSFLKTIFDVNGTSSGNLLFIKTSAATDISSIETQLQKISERYDETIKKEDGKTVHRLQPLHDLHYNSELGTFDSGRSPAHKGTLTTLSVVAIFLLLIAAINFINLETAQAARRAREVGVRKVLGSTRGQLTWHFLVQSIFLSAVAVILAIPLAQMGLIFFSDFIPSGVALDFTEPALVLFFAGIILIVGILAGAYPAFVLSSFLPALALKNQAYVNSANTRTAYLRKGLIVFQFGFAQLLIIGTMVIISQINFMLNKDLGFKKDAIIYLSTPRKDVDDKKMTLKGELSQLPGVSELSLCSAPPSAQEYRSAFLVYKNGKEEIKTESYFKFGDEKYMPLYEIELIAGRNLLPSDAKQGVVINEAFVKELGLSASEAIGKELWQNKKAYSIVGVAKNFHTASLHDHIKPVMILENPDLMRRFSIKLMTNGDGSEKFQESISKIEATWKKIYPDLEFKYEFVNDTIKRFYETEQRMSKLTATAMTIAIIICCLGLFGLVSFTAIQRTKEIGIRKVLGATVSSIVLLLSTDFLKLVLLAFVIASPVAYYGSLKFLEDYAFRFEFGWQLFALAGFASLVLAFVTVSYHAAKSATGNPVTSLRSE
ncbi:ABC transporter permease [Cytophagales bacterium WSM2-2]|nr:ABC transporter permease [Cytophagales bacterium WSM2-2]